MPATAARTLTLTPEEYFAWEPTQTVRHEYHFGEVFPMPGGTFEHATVIANLTVALGVALRGHRCRLVSNEMRVQVLENGQYVYPDATVYCGPPAFVNERRTTLTNPTVVFEVLSDETRSYDLDGKFALYRGVCRCRPWGSSSPNGAGCRLRTEARRAGGARSPSPKAPSRSARWMSRWSWPTSTPACSRPLAALASEAGAVGLAYTSSGVGASPPPCPPRPPALGRVIPAV